MTITLRKATVSDCGLLHSMQVETFMPLLEKYKDYEISPAAEPVEKTFNRLNQPFTDYYLIFKGEEAIGGIRIVKQYKNTCVISPIFILEKYQGKGIGQEVMTMIESMYPKADYWVLDTIEEEKRTCHFYEKMGFKKVGDSEKVNDAMTLIIYEKETKR